MKKQVLLLLLTVLTAGTASASTFAKFAVYYGIIRVLPKDPAGNADGDSVKLFEAMNVPIKDSFLGPGKVIQTKDNALQFICANRAQAGYECSIFIQPSSRSTVNPFEGVMDFQAQGAEADEFAKQFHLDAGNAFLFTSVDNILKVEVRPGSFLVHLKQNSPMP